MLRLLHGQFDILLVVEDARRLKVLTLTSLRRRHGSAASAWLLHKLFDILLVVEDARRLKVLTLTSLRRRHGSASSAWRSRFIS
jgi:DNA transposition AAA+ family ATPase